MWHSRGAQRGWKMRAETSRPRIHILLEYAEYAPDLLWIDDDDLEPGGLEPRMPRATE